MVSWDIEFLDKEVGEIKKHSLILIHEEDLPSRGRDLLYYIMAEKLRKGNLVGYFNISYPLQMVFRALERFNLNPIELLHSRILAIIDTFGSFYGIKTNLPGVWYLEGMLSSETLPGKYAKVIEAHKSVWAREGMFKDRDIFGFAVAMSSYLDIFGSREETLRYLELSAEVRSKHSAYKKYPRGTNFWLWVGKRDEGVLNSVYRRADYVLRTRSRFTEEGIKRELLVLKTPELVEDIPVFEYEFKGDKIVGRRIC
ncbi:hypothetical protein PFDSM3638_02085 [Pyrococcus furiosus DSM 3638]|uniref:Uncharacterized protein n=3 Tax=Pyrococcus furiosus TaxID=2261 RepID=A0A5C0XMR9_PYRFU|nr:hypothetical protein [Pyrococcus furiosus]AAL80549.1 hypothetical protein PF0425 [Pyrococcus furiosus DSM 3638]AFN03213.1 hypothetical protein PFC_01210 [Pyrococcus furiosus COM1]QEK78137.1 hypothetical protein PFDSM3638_02085 [Pyrococcus furiosus DSM 3638]